MSKYKLIRYFCNILIAILLLLFILSLLWFINGSLEMTPTAEQQDKARIGAIFSMVIIGISCFICVVARVKFRK